MKYSKSALPYLVILFIVLIGMPLANYQMQSTQQVVVEVKFQRPNIKNTQLANSKTSKNYKKKYRGQGR